MAIRRAHVALGVALLAGALAGPVVTGQLDAVDGTGDAVLTAGEVLARASVDGVGSALAATPPGAPADAVEVLLEPTFAVSGLAVYRDGAVESSTGAAPALLPSPPDRTTVLSLGTSWWRVAAPLPDGRFVVADLGIGSLTRPLQELAHVAPISLATADSVLPLNGAGPAPGEAEERAVGTSGLMLRVASSSPAPLGSSSLGWITGALGALALAIAGLAAADRRRARRTADAHQAEIDDLARRFDLLAHTDPLTGAANEVRFLDDLRGYQSRAERYGHAFALALFEIDHLDAYEMTYGPERADEVRVSVAHRLLAEARTGDTVYRLRDGRFAGLFPEQTGEQAAIAAERMRRAVVDLGLEHLRNPAGGIVTLTAGVSGSEPEDRSPSATMLRAAGALDHAAAQGRACTRVAARPLSPFAVVPTR